VTLWNDKRNKFERKYTKKFEERAAEHGIGLEYEEDRAALDYGLHLTVPGDDGDSLEGVTSTRVWFQFKGQGRTTLTREAFDSSDDIAVSVEIDHLRQWYRYSEPVYLTIYVEAVDDFFAVDVKQLVEERWGDSVFKDRTFKETESRKGRARQKKVTVKIPKAARVDEGFWARLRAHRSMRIDGAAYRGAPLAHAYDFETRTPLRMEPVIYAGVIGDLLAAHNYRAKASIDPYQLYPESDSAGDVIELTTGVMYDPYEFIPYMTRELLGDEEGFREEGQVFKAHGRCAVLIHSNVVSRPDAGRISGLAEALEQDGIKNLLVFANHFMLDQPIVGEPGYNCFPEYSQGTAGTDVLCIPQHLEDVGRNILLATTVYTKHRERIPWLDEVFRKKLESGELRIVAAPW
jgi:hypothetical protein